MNIARYNLAVETILSDEIIIQQSVSRKVFRYQKGYWRDDRNATVTDARLVVDLDKTRELTRPWRPTSSSLAYFPIDDLDAVVLATFWSAPSKPKRDAFEKRLKICLSAADNKFAATHHATTGLLNGQAFNTRLDEAIFQLCSHRTSDQQEVLETKGNIAICIIAIDIDHFKQINDNYGHMYGDIVLQALAIRLERVARKSGSELEIEVVPVHPSGEEFLGPVDKPALALARPERLGRRDSRVAPGVTS